MYLALGCCVALFSKSCVQVPIDRSKLVWAYGRLGGLEIETGTCSVLNHLKLVGTSSL